MSKVDRQPAIKRQHPAADLPARETTSPSTSSVGGQTAPTAPSAPTTPVSPAASERSAPTGASVPQPYDGPEKYSQVMNVRVRPTTEDRVHRVLDTLPRSWSKQALTDAALNEFIDKYGLDPSGS